MDLSGLLKPGCVLNLYIIEDKHILVIYAPAGDMRPYSAPESLGQKRGQNRQYYIRSGSRSIIAKNDNLRKLQELAARVPFDDRINQEADLNDLSLGLIRDFLQEVRSDLFEESTAMPFVDLCRQMNIVKGPQEGVRPLNVGLLFFSHEPHKFFQRSWIEVVIREDEAGKDFKEKYNDYSMLYLNFNKDINHYHLPTKTGTTLLSFS